MKNKGVALVGGIIEGKPIAMCAITNDLVSNINANEVIKEVGIAMGGGGGGKPYLATAGGKDKNKLKQSINVGKEFILGRIS